MAKLGGGGGGVVVFVAISSPLRVWGFCLMPVCSVFLLWIPSSSHLPPELTLPGVPGAR